MKCLSIWVGRIHQKYFGAGGKDWADNACSASIFVLTPLLWAVFANKPRNVGHILPCSWDKAFCSPAPDLFGHRRLDSKIAEKKKAPALSLSPFSGWGGRSWEQPDHRLLPWGEGRVTSPLSEQGSHQPPGRSGSNPFSFLTPGASPLHLCILTYSGRYLWEGGMDVQKPFRLWAPSWITTGWGRCEAVPGWGRVVEWVSGRFC